MDADGLICLLLLAVDLMDAEGDEGTEEEEEEKQRQHPAVLMPLLD